MPCPGDPLQSCGGLWRVNVYRIREDVARDEDITSWIFVVGTAIFRAVGARSFACHSAPHLQHLPK